MENNNEVEKKRRKRKKKTHSDVVVEPPSNTKTNVVVEQKPSTKRKNHKKKPSTTPTEKKIYTPFELFYDEGLSKMGWGGLLHPLYNEVEKWNKDKNDDTKFKFSQIKEKWGYLNLYNFGATEEQWKRIRMCENASNHICMLCGSPFKVGKTKGWITTMCEECAIKEDKVYSPKDKVFIFQNKNSDKDVHHINAQTYKEAIEKLTDVIEKEYKRIDNNWCLKTSELNDIVRSRYKLIDKSKATNWVLWYDSVRITPIIKIALKLQSLGFELKKIKEKISHFFWMRKGNIKFIFYHYVLRNDRFDKTIFNYLKY